MSGWEEPVSVDDPAFRDMSNRIHGAMDVDPLLGPCSGTHLMGYGTCQRVALIVRRELRAALSANPLADQIQALAITALTEANVDTRWFEQMVAGLRSREREVREDGGLEELRRLSDAADIEERTETAYNKRYPRRSFEITTARSEFREAAVNHVRAALSGSSTAPLDRLMDEIEALPRREANSVRSSGPLFPDRDRDDWVEVVEYSAVHDSLERAASPDPAQPDRAAGEGLG